MQIQGTEQFPFNPDQAAEFIESVFAMNRTPFLVGPPGVGKTQCVHQVAKKLGLPVEVRLLSQYEPSDFVGLPHIYEDAKGRKRSKFAIPEAFDFDRPVVLFLDEWAQADISVQRASSEIVLEHSFGGIPLANGTFVVAASNRKQDRAGVSEVLGHNKSRMVTAHVGVNSGQWIDWALRNGVDQSIVAYISTKGNASLLNVDHKAYSYPCPRTWIMVNDALQQAANGRISENMLSSVVAGSIGQTEAAAFLMFRETFEERPTMKEILTGPASAKIPKKHPDRVQVAIMVVSNLEGAEAADGGVEACVEYLERLDREAVQAAMKKVLGDATKEANGRLSQLIGRVRGMLSA